MRLNLKHLTQRGDTIVEVLIAVAVVTSVLAGAFTVAQRSTKTVRDSQEQAEMLQTLQGQVELVRSLALAQDTDTTGVYAPSPKFFCIKASDQTIKHLPITTPTLPPLASDDFAVSNYGTDCKDIKDSKGNASRYNVAITYNSSNKTFTFTGRWEGIGDINRQEIMSYRVYPGVALVSVTPPPVPPPVTCTPGSQKDIILTLDYSASMNQLWGSPTRTKLSSLRQQTAYLIDNINLSATGNRAAFVWFNTSAGTARQFSVNGPDLKTAINNQGTVIDTFYGLALQETIDEMPFARPGVQKVVLFISDGRADDPAAIPAKMAQLSAMGVVVHTVAIDVASDTTAQAILQSMAIGGGSYSQADSPAEFESIIQSLATTVKCNTVTPPPPPPPPLPISCIDKVEINVALDKTFNLPQNLKDFDDYDRANKTQYTHPGSISGITAGCRYEYRLRASDASHPHTVPSEQDNESVAAYFYDSSGIEVGFTALTDDFPDSQEESSWKEGSICFSGAPSTLTFKHYFRVTGIIAYASVQPSRLELRNPTTC